MWIRAGWGAGETHVVRVTQPLPPDIDAGSYDVLLHLPDPDGRAAYSIRLANRDVWETATGFNNIRSRVVVRSKRRGSAAEAAQV
jgi:hypothetical protein